MIFESSATGAQFLFTAGLPDEALRKALELDPETEPGRWMWDESAHDWLRFEDQTDEDGDMNESGNRPPGDDDWGGTEETPWQQPPPGQQPQQPPQEPQQPAYGQQPPQYGQQPPPYGGQQPPQYGGPPTHQPGEQIPNYLVHSIVATLLCCLPPASSGSCTRPR